MKNKIIKHLLDYGWNPDDVEKMADIWILSGTKGIKEEFAWMDDSEHDYTSELIDNLREIL